MPFLRLAFGLTAAVMLSGSISSATAQSADYKVVDAADLAIGPRKYFDRDIEIRRLKCMYADTSDYRCVTGEAVTIFTSAVQPPDMDAWIKDNCDSLKVVATSPKCTFDVRFRFNGDQIDSDIISGYQKRTTVSPNHIILVRSTKKR